ncbi:MAG: tRNA (guanine(46)-N(7))-methyltransferase TrmB [Methyloceanibacter sp.]|uniref:tRNA (guanine(46)-N(7))-methyltransferase TrmB n=1 Tax=Methyloceanibacter sp. TaxID=1965321 RepID=UPI003D6CA6F3
MVDDRSRQLTETRPLRSYGRRKGKRLSPRKERLVAELLPRLRPDLKTAAPRDLRTLFPVPVREVWLEIGFGSGEHLLWQAERHPDVGFIGCEPFINGVATLLGAIEDRGLKTILVHDGDVRDVLAWLPDGAISRAFLLFPDPWPKKRQLKRRLVSPELIDSLARVMASGGEIRFASDDIDYADQAALIVSGSGAFAGLNRRWQRPDDWPETRYERKALSEGRKPVYLSWRRV